MSANYSKIRRDCAAAREAFAHARSGHYALGAFNLDNQETLKAVTFAAKAKKSPILVEVSKGEVDALGLDNVRDMVDNYKADYGVEMYINLDHSPTVEDAIAGITAGFECIHIDISQAEHNATDKEIIAKTKEVVRAAKLTGALVEAEPHYFGGSSNLHTEKIDYAEIKKFFTKPEEAQKFVEETGIDTYAAAIGNLHGHYPVPKVLHIDLLKEIRAALDCNISLHGGSGTPGHYFVEAVKIGVTKININSDMRIAYRETLEKALKDNKTEYAVVKLMDGVIEAVQKVVEAKIDMFNSSGKARV
jgi:fructose-bisphosphate aldolase class II